MSNRTLVWAIYCLAICLCAAFFAIGYGVRAAEGIPIDPTDNKVTKQEARSTLVGEIKADLEDRIGPVDHHGNCAPHKERCTVAYRLYGTWQRPEYWSVRYFRPGLPFTDRTLGPWQVYNWSFRACPYAGCSWDRTPNTDVHHYGRKQR